ncbi:MAG: helix-turn-helix transcriptional regulator [Spirochaetales bacterium]|nr:helix-turn-helix transcriptional regulator [Spirochaetales bacterium]
MQNKMPPSIGRGTAEFAALSSRLAYAHFKCSEIVREISSRLELLADQFKFTFHLSPDTVTAGIEGLDKPLMLFPGASHILGPSVVTFYTAVPGQIVHEFNIFADPELIREVFTAEGKTIPELLKPCFEGDADPAFYLLGWTTVEMRMIIQQLLNCSLECPLGLLYKEGKALELLALRLEQAGNNAFLNAGPALLKKDLEILDSVRQILDDRFNTPPTISELSRIAGTNPTKLKSMFKSRFGNTLYGYVRSQRMTAALKLIQDGICDVTEAAFRVGYRSVSAFIHAFKSEYGLSPGSFRKK